MLNNDFFQGDYYNLEEYNPNRVFDDYNGDTSLFIETIDSLLEDGSVKRRASHDGEAYVDGRYIMCERHFRFHEEEAGYEYGSRPIWHHAKISYYEDIANKSKNYDIVTSISIGGVRHHMLKNRYIIGIVGDAEKIVEAKTEYPDMLFDGTRSRLMTPFDLGQAQKTLNVIKDDINKPEDCRLRDGDI